MFDYRAVPIEPNDKKILLIIIDGLGGLQRNGKTELQTAWMPNMQKLAMNSSLGLLVPIAPSVTPGSGAAHLAIFGYDPTRYEVGRGVIEVLGSGLTPAPGDLCCRANFATVDSTGVVVDRRAKKDGERMADEECRALCAELQRAIPRIDDVVVTIKPGKGHRFVVVFSGPGLREGLTDSDPGKEGKRPLAVKSLNPEAGRAADIVNRFIELSAGLLKRRERANFVLLRGAGLPPDLPSFSERYKLRAACIAAYPMYKGLARLLGMEVLECGETWEGELKALAQYRNDFDFFYLHFKEFDQAGEDGNFEYKVELLERFDEMVIPQVVKMGFDVLCITGDHSTPAVLRGHSWHPVPILLNAASARSFPIKEEFSERSCTYGSLGVIYGLELMPLLLAHAFRYGKFGA